MRLGKDGSGLARRVGDFMRMIESRPELGVRILLDLAELLVGRLRQTNHDVTRLTTALSIDDFIKSRQNGRHSKKLQMQGARILRNEAYIIVRRNDEG